MPRQVKVTAIIPAAGSGSRAGSTPKQYMELLGKPVLEWTLAAVSASEAVDSIILVTPANDVDMMSGKYLKNKTFPKVASVVSGGAKRGDSVRNGVMQAASEFVLIHDAARPFLSPPLVKRVVESAMAHGCTTAALPAHDTVKARQGEFLGAAVDRSTLLLIQTPQVFKREALLKAYEIKKDEASDWTDETSLMQSAGFSVAWVVGETVNFKITTPDDFRLAQAIAHFGARET